MDAPECMVVGKELVTVARSVKASKMTCKCETIEPDMEHAGKDVGIWPKVKQVVKVLQGEEWEDHG